MSTATAKAMTVPWFDALCVGGASILFLAAVALFDIPWCSESWGDAVFALGVALNQPHIIGSYALVYENRASVQRYWKVGLLVPALLLAYLVAIAVLLPASRVSLLVSLPVNFLLAWHYTGQSWGMMASFGHLSGLRFTDLERRLVRTNLTALLLFHCFTYAHTYLHVDLFPTGGPPALARFDEAHVVAFAVAEGTALLGLFGLLSAWRRTGKRPELRVWLPWIAVHLWYVAMFVNWRAMYWVQIFHAIQYLPFLLRVQANRQTDGTAQFAAGLGRGSYLGLYAVYLIGISAVAYQAFPWLVEIFGGVTAAFALGRFFDF
ncbi:MAG: hypothetical protein ACK4N5_22050, partial [Myxococcales bacterium]